MVYLGPLNEEDLQRELGQKSLQKTEDRSDLYIAMAVIFAVGASLIALTAELYVLLGF